MEATDISPLVGALILLVLVLVVLGPVAQGVEIVKDQGSIDLRRLRSTPHPRNFKIRHLVKPGTVPLIEKFIVSIDGIEFVRDPHPECSLGHEPWENSFDSLEEAQRWVSKYQGYQQVNLSKRKVNEIAWADPKYSEPKETVHKNSPLGKYLLEKGVSEKVITEVILTQNQHELEIKELINS
jgi:hypothetical protein